MAAPGSLFQRPDRIKHPLYVVTTVFNPIRFRSRWKLYADFALRCEQAGAILYTVEVAFGHRNFVIAEPNNPRHLQLTTSHELWLKENSLNLIIQRLPLDWKYAAWVDADVMFAREDWANDTLHQLQHYPIVQMWSEAQDLDSHHQAIQTHKSFAYCYVHKLQVPPNCDGYYYGGSKKIYWHPGYAWAIRREAFNALGGLMDFCILGSADFHMANALIGNVDATILSPLHERFKYQMRRWEARAETYIKRNIGYVPGMLLHKWHGAKVFRRYQDRWKILTETQYNPDEDLKYDWAGLLQLTDRSIELRDRLRAYFRAREEDQLSNEVAWAASVNPNDSAR